MKHVVLIGDYDLILVELGEILSNSHQISGIRYNGNPLSKQALANNWVEIEYSNFHQLTITLMDLEPDVVIYLSPYLRLSRSNSQKEITHMTTVEVVKHMTDIMDVINPHFIVFRPDEIILQYSEALQLLVQEMTEYVLDMKKATVINYHPIISKSKIGFSSWYIASGSPNLNVSQFLHISELTHTVLEIIDTKKYGIVTPPSVAKIELAEVEDFVGNPKDFSVFIEDL